MPNGKGKLYKFWKDLKHRKVFRVLAMYAATTYIILEAADIVLPRLGLPDWTVTLLIIIIIAGFPVTAIFSWIFDLTPEGLKRTDSTPAEPPEEKDFRPYKKIINFNNIVIALLFVVVCILLYPKIFSDRATTDNQETVEKSMDQLAVLPFSNTRSDPETDYLGFAMADQIIGSLGYLNHLTVRPSGSIRKYTTQAFDPLTAAKELKVDYVLIGNYLKENDKIRLNIELVEVTTNKLLWNEPVEVAYTSAFDLQDIVTQKVVERLNIQFTEMELEIIGKDIPDDPVAYEYYLRGISYPLTTEGDQLAIEMLNRSIEKDNTFAPAYARLADRLHTIAVYGEVDSDEINRSRNLNKRAEEFYKQALKINGDQIFALAGLAMIYTETARIEDAMELIKKILIINPNNPDALFSLGYIYRYAGMNSESVREMEKAINLDPENPRFRSIIFSYEYVGDFKKALVLLEKSEQNTFTIGQQGMMLYRLGNIKQALSKFIQVIELDPGSSDAIWAESLKSIIEGDTASGQKILNKWEGANVTDAEAWYQFGNQYGLLGDVDGCVRCLKRAVDGGFFNYPFMSTDSFLDPVRDDPRLQKILDQAKRKHEAFIERFF